MNITVEELNVPRDCFSDRALVHQACMFCLVGLAGSSSCATSASAHPTASSHIIRLGPSHGPLPSSLDVTRRGHSSLVQRVTKNHHPPVTPCCRCSQNHGTDVVALHHPRAKMRTIHRDQPDLLNEQLRPPSLGESKHLLLLVDITAG